MTKTKDLKVCGRVFIHFYDNDKVSVVYEIDSPTNQEESNDAIISDLFLFYFARILCNLDKGINSLTLIKSVEEFIKNILNNKKIDRVRFLSKPELVSKEKALPLVEYKGELYENGNDGEKRFIQTYMTVGKEEYYAPASVIMFMQYLVDSLPTRSLVFFLISLYGMVVYYQKGGDYSKPEDALDARNFALNFCMSNRAKLEEYLAANTVSE